MEVHTGGDCTMPVELGIRLVIQNAGGTASGPFTFEVNGSQTAFPTGLEPGQAFSTWLSGFVGVETEVIVDLADQVDESNEDNNNIFSFLPIPPVAPPCTPTPE